VKPRWAEITDTGPGVGVCNSEVRFRDAEKAIIHDSDYRVQIHNSRDSSENNEAERTNSAIGDSVIDDATLQWEKYPKFHNLTDEQIASMTMNESMRHMKHKGWRIMHSLLPKHSKNV